MTAQRRFEATYSEYKLKIMEQVVLVCGKWMFDKSRWLFVVDNNRGCRILQGNSKTRYVDFIRMVYEDYGLDKRVWDVELSYMLPKKVSQKLPPDTPPVIIGNCRQFQTFLGQSKIDTVRLCVVVKEKAMGKSKQIVEDDYVECNEMKKRTKVEESWVGNEVKSHIHGIVNNIGDNLEKEDEDEDESRFDYCDDSDGTNSDDENYSLYGIPPKDEVEKPKLPIKKRSSTTFIDEGNEDTDFVKLEMSSVDLAVGQCYQTKEHLETRLKILTVVQKFDFYVDKSTPFLLTVKCWVKGCTWRVRAAPLRDYPKFHVRVYVAEHSCSITERSARTRQATHEILGVLYKDFVGGVGPTIRPMHVAEALNKRFQIKVRIFLNTMSMYF